MTIDKINLGKVQVQKEIESKKQEKQVPVYENNEPQAVLKKLRGAAAAHYLAAMMGLASLASCAEADSLAIADNKHSEEFKKLLQTIIENQKTQTEVLMGILNAANQNNADNKVLIDLAEKQYSQSLQISKICADVSADIKDIKTAIFDIRNLMIEANQNDEELQAKIDIIIASNASDSEKLQQLIDLNSEQNAWLINIASLIGELKNQGSDLGDKFEQFYNDYTTNSAEFKNNDKDHTALMQLMYEELKKNTADNAQINAKLDAIMKSGADDSEKLAQLVALVGSIDMKMDIVIDKIGDLATEIASLRLVINENNVDMLIELGKINANLDEVKELQRENNKAVVKTAQNTDEIIAKMNQFGDKFFTLEELQDMLGPMFKEVVDKIPPAGLTGSELSAILEGYKTDLTKTNSLIENLTEVVKNLRISGGGISPEQLQALTDAIEAFRQQEATNDAAQMEAYQALMDEIAGLKGGIEAMATALANASQKFDDYTANAKRYGDQMLKYMEKLRDGQTNVVSTIEACAQKANDAMVQAQQARNEQIALLQSILAKETGGNGGITKEELKEVLSELGLNPNDYTPLLEEISDKIGKVITSDDLQNFYLKTQPDLTKTNALIETLIDVLKNKNFSVTGDVTVNMLEVENLLGQIYDKMVQGKAPTSDQIAALQDAVDQIVANTNTTTPTAKATRCSLTADASVFYNAMRALAAQDVYNA